MARYLVFATATFDQGLTHQGAVDATDADEAVVVARRSFPGDWVAMTLIPEREVRWVLHADHHNAP